MTAKADIIINKSLNEIIKRSLNSSPAKPIKRKKQIMNAYTLMKPDKLLESMKPDKLLAVMKPDKLLAIIVLFLVAMVFIRCEGDSSSSSDSGQGGSLARFTIKDNYLYTVDHSQLKSFDISEPARPEFKSNIRVGFGVETIFPYDSLLFLGTNTGMYIYGTSNPGNPTELSFFQHITSCDPVVTDGKYAYVTLNSLNDWCGRNTNELQIVDVSNPYKPSLLKTYDMIQPRGLGVQDSLLFICDDYLKVYDVSNPLEMQLLQEFNITSKDVIPLENILLVVGEGGFFQYLYKDGGLQLLSRINIDAN